MKAQEFDPANRAKAKHLLNRLFGICELHGWEHGDLSRPEEAFHFRPWGPDRAVVSAAVGIWEMSGPQQTVRLPLLMLGLRWLAPEPLVSRALHDVLDACARYGISLTIGNVIPAPGQAWPNVDICLTHAIPERSLGTASVEDAVQLLAAAQLELAELCRRVMG